MLSVEEASQRIKAASLSRSPLQTPKENPVLPFRGYRDVLEPALKWMRDKRHLCTIWRAKEGDRTLATGAFPVFVGDNFEVVLYKYSKVFKEEFSEFRQSMKAIRSAMKDPLGMSQTRNLRLSQMWPPRLYHVLDTIRKCGGVDWIEGAAQKHVRELMPSLFIGKSKNKGD